MRVVLASAGAAIALAAVVVAACNGDIPQPIACHDIPDGGCPLGYGDPCTDPTCATAYQCDDTSGAWVLDHACPAHPDAGQDAEPRPDAGDAADTGAARDVDVDVPGANGGPGCADLEPPDCPLGVAASCPGTDCCGCEDLFVCVNGGWDPWGYCGDGGITPR
jgi:hypothetical protein